MEQCSKCAENTKLRKELARIALGFGWQGDVARTALGLDGDKSVDELRKQPAN